MRRAPITSGGEPLHDPGRRGFASDNHAGAHPEVLEALVRANGGHQPAYGADVYTEALGEVCRRHFGARAQVYPVFNGTGANVVALDLMTRRWDAVVCAQSAHINTDECGAPERLAGIKMLPVPTADGRLTPADVEAAAVGRGDEHHARAAVVSLTQSTELGTVYEVGELADLAAAAHRLGMTVHLDGARLANAAAALDVSLGALTSEVGVDVVSFGGTKNGLLGAEAVIVCEPRAVSLPLFVRKLSGQLASKMRFLSVQLLTLLDGDLWLRSARRANEAAALLADSVRGLDGVRITREPRANAVFATLPPAVTARLQARFPFHVWDAATGEVRWMCAFDTTDADIDAFVEALRIESARG